jgi:hypothetical protein
VCENETPNPVVLGEVSVTAGNDVNKKIPQNKLLCNIYSCGG